MPRRSDGFTLWAVIKLLNPKPIMSDHSMIFLEKYSRTKKTVLWNRREATEVEVKEQHCATTTYLNASTAWSGLQDSPWLKRLQIQKSHSCTVLFCSFNYRIFDLQKNTHQLYLSTWPLKQSQTDTLFSFYICVTMCMFDTIMTWHIWSTRSKTDPHAQDFPHLRDLQRLTGLMIGMIKQKATVTIGWQYQNCTQCPATVSRSSHLWSMCFTLCWLASFRITST